MMCALRDDLPKIFSKVKWVGKNRRGRKRMGVIITEVASVSDNIDGGESFFYRINSRTIDRLLTDCTAIYINPSRTNISFAILFQLFYIFESTF